MLSEMIAKNGRDQTTWNCSLYRSHISDEHIHRNNLRLAESSEKYANVSWLS